MIEFVAGQSRAMPHFALQLATAAFLALGVLPSTAAADTPVNAELSSLVVVVAGFPDDEGMARIALMLGKQEYESEDEGPHRASLSISGGRVEWKLSDLRHGEYAIQVFHDANANEELDSSWMGAPKEHYGFSNNPPRRLGPAKWKDAKFTIDTPEVEKTIHLMAPPF